jgi:hypothetical protein
MPVESLVFRLLVASPSDCSVERGVVREVVTEWNATYSLSERVMIEPVFWETHSRPALGDRPQAIINEQLVADSDLAIGIFYTRLGTPTGAAESGTVEEIDEMLRQNKRVLLYFSSVPIQPDSVDRAEYDRLVAYRTRMQTAGLYFRYPDHAEFRRLVSRHLSQEITALVAEHRAQTGAVGNGSTPAAGSTATPGPSRTASDTFAAALRRLGAEWRAERDSDPINIDDGKQILARVASQATQLRSALGDDDGEQAQILDAAVRDARTLQRHMLFLDGGGSFREFWEKGTALLDALGRLQR